MTLSYDDDDDDDLQVVVQVQIQVDDEGEVGSIVVFFVMWFGLYSDLLIFLGQ